MPDPYNRLMRPDFQANTELPQWQDMAEPQDTPDFGPMMGMLKQKIGARQSTKMPTGNMAIGKAMKPAGGGMESL